MPVDPARAPLAAAEAGAATALLIVDMIGAWDFPDSDRLGPAAAAIAPRIAALKRRCAEAGMAVVYVNDNRDRWRSEFSEIVRLAATSGVTGAAIDASLAPDSDDYSVLKPKHSAFYATPLELLLRHLRVKRLLVTGVASDLCIAMTAAEARMRDYEVLVPGDCIAALTAERNADAIRQLSEVHGIETTPSERLRL